MELLLKNVQKKHLALINELAKSLDITVEAPTKPLYNPDFVAKILESEAEFKAGKGVSIPLEDLWK